tara:strand:- start:706 stop:915 length:210 start_codon:yes stop_codon:yes gene_type:complete
MITYETSLSDHATAQEVSNWFAQPGPTESFLRNAPKELLKENHETVTVVTPDPGYFTQVGPTPGFVYCR